MYSGALRWIILLFTKKHLPQPKVDFMITSLYNLSPYSAKKLAFFLQTNVMINFFPKLAVF
jgi:hypothetical protein